MRFVYLDGEPFDRVSNTAVEMARSLGAWIVRVEPFDDPICGPSERVWLRSLRAQLETRRHLERLLDADGDTVDPVQHEVWWQELERVVSQLQAGPESSWTVSR